MHIVVLGTIRSWCVSILGGRLHVRCRWGDEDLLNLGEEGGDGANCSIPIYKELECIRARAM